MTITTCLWGLYLGRHYSLHYSLHLSFWSLYVGLCMSSLEQDKTASLSPVDHGLVLLSNTLLECPLVYRGVVCSGSPDLYIALHSAVLLAIMLSDIDETDLCSEHSTYSPETSSDILPPKRSRHLRRRSLLSSGRWLRDRYADDIEYSRSELSEDSDSLSSDCSLYKSRLSKRYISEPAPSLDMVRPRKWLSLLLGLEFLDILKKRNKTSRRKRNKMPSRERPSQAFIIEPPEDFREEDFRPKRRTTRTRYILRRMDSNPMSEPQRNRRPRDDRPRIVETRTFPRYRYRREEPIVTERKPPRRGQRTSPDRTFEVHKIVPLKEPQSYWAQQVDRESMRAFEENATRPTRLERSMPKQGGYARLSDEPEPITIEHRAPRPRERRTTFQIRESGKVEERAPRIGLEERSPRKQPRVIQYGLSGLSRSGPEVLARARSRRDNIQIQADIWVETERTRRTRRIGERTPRPYGPSR